MKWWTEAILIAGGVVGLSTAAVLYQVNKVVDLKELFASDKPSLDEIIKKPFTFDRLDSNLMVFVDDSLSQPETAEEYLNQSLAEVSNGRPMYATAAALNVFENDPTSRQQIEAAYVLLAVGQSDYATQKLEVMKAQGIDPDRNVSVLLGEAYRVQGRNAESICALEDALRESDPSMQGGIYESLGKTHAAADDYAGAVAAFERISKEDKVYAQSRLGLAKIHFDNDQGVAGLETLQQFPKDSGLTSTLDVFGEGGGIRFQFDMFYGVQMGIVQKALELHNLDVAQQARDKIEVPVLNDVADQLIQMYFSKHAL